MAGMRTISRPWAVVGCGIGLLAGLGAGRADVIALRGGGQVRGKVVPDPDHSDRVLILTEKGKGPLSFEKPKVQHVTPEPSVLDEYVRRRNLTSRTAEAEYDLGLWCDGQKLTGLAQLHYEAAVRQDKTMAPAHQKLGHVLRGDLWLTPDESREAQGLVRYKGKWVTKEEKERYEEQAAATAEQLALAKRIRGLRNTIATGSEDRRLNAEDELSQLRDPTVVRPLVRVLGVDEEPAFRTLLDRLLGAISGPEAASALISRVLMEADPEVRPLTLMQLERHDESNIVPLLTRALRSPHSVVVNRAAWALGQRNVVAVVPKLISALHTTELRLVLVGTGDGGGGSGMSFGSVSPSAGLNSGGYVSATTPVVGVGAVGSGVSTAPYGASMPLSTGNGGRAPVPRLVPITYQNVEVLAALVKLTGQDFGFDTDIWKRWVRTSFHPDPAPVRKVPQP